MPNTQPIQDEVKDISQDELNYPFLQEGLVWSKKMQEHTPNWKQKLTATLIPMIIPMTSLAKDFLDYHEEGVKAYDDLPEAEVQDISLLPHHAEQMWSALSVPFSVQEGQSVTDMFHYQMGHMLLPELTMRDIQDMKGNQKNKEKVKKAIEEYSKNYPDIYQLVEKNYNFALRDLNQKNPVYENGKFKKAGEIKVPDMTYIINKAQFDNVAQSIKK